MKLLLPVVRSETELLLLLLSLTGVSCRKHPISDTERKRERMGEREREREAMAKDGIRFNLLRPLGGGKQAWYRLDIFRPLEFSFHQSWICQIEIFFFSIGFSSFDALTFTKPCKIIDTFTVDWNKRNKLDLWKKNILNLRSRQTTSFKINYRNMQISCLFQVRTHPSQRLHSTR